MSDALLLAAKSDKKEKSIGQTMQKTQLRKV